jgi:hypothetical protein
MTDYQQLCKQASGICGGHVVLSLRDNSGMLEMRLIFQHGENGENKQIVSAMDTRDSEAITAIIIRLMESAAKLNEAIPR